MAKRFFLTDIVTDQDTELGTVHQPAINRVLFPPGTTVRWAWNEALPWALAVVSHPIAVPAVTETNTDALPEYDLDGRLDGIEGAARQALNAAVNSRSIAGIPLANRDSLRETLTALGKKHSPDFSIDSFGLVS